VRLFVIGASGRLGRHIVAEAVRRGHLVSGQSRLAGRLSPDVQPMVGHADDAQFLAATLPGHDAVVSALGIDHAGPTTLFSDATRALLAAMSTAAVHRLVAITGAGNGESCGPGGWRSSRLLRSFYARPRHPDKDAQEDLIAASDLDWTIIRPAPIAAGPLKGGLHAVWPVPRHMQVTAVTRSEIAEVVLDAVEQHRWRHARPLVGHFA